MSGSSFPQPPYGPDFWDELRELLIETCVVKPFRLTDEQKQQAEPFLRSDYIAAPVNSGPIVIMRREGGA